MNNRGFTLVEVIVAMVLLGILLVIAAPSLNRWRESAGYKEVARGILVGLREARSRAVTENKTVTATIDLAAHQLSYDGITKNFSATIKLEVDNDTSLQDSDPRSITFYPQGSCDLPIYIRVNEDPGLYISVDSTAIGLAKM